MEIKAYKGFNADMTCRDFQFEEGKTYKENEAKLCDAGFHACTDPIDCFSYYSPANGAIYRSVELDGVSDERENDSKICGNKIKIGAALTFGEIIDTSVRLAIKKVKNSPNSSSGYSSTAASSGDYSTASAIGANTIAAAIGRDTKVKGDIGTWIVAPEYGDYDGKGYPIIGIVSAKIDGEVLKPNTWYTVKVGKFVAAV